MIYTIDLITLCCSPLLLWKASKSWRSLFYILSTSHIPWQYSSLVWWQFLFLKHLVDFFFFSRAVEKVDCSAHNLPPFLLILVFVRSAALLYSCVSAPPVLGRSLLCCLDLFPPRWVEESAPSDSPRVLCRNHISWIRSSCMLLAYFESQS